MGAPKKLKKPVYVTTILERAQQEALKRMAYRQAKPMSELVREALARYISQESNSSGGDLMSLRGAGKGVWNEDAQEYINKLREDRLD